MAVSIYDNYNKFNTKFAHILVNYEFIHSLRKENKQQKAINKLLKKIYRL